MSNENNSTSGGVSAASLLGILFVALKLTGFIDWSWWYVTMPFWAPLCIILVIVLIVAVVAAMSR